MLRWCPEATCPHFVIPSPLWCDLHHTAVTLVRWLAFPLSQPATLTLEVLKGTVFFPKSLIIIRFIKNFPMSLLLIPECQCWAGALRTLKSFHHFLSPCAVVRAHPPQWQSRTSPCFLLRRLRLELLLGWGAEHRAAGEMTLLTSDFCPSTSNRHTAEPAAIHKSLQKTFYCICWLFMSCCSCPEGAERRGEQQSGPHYSRDTSTTLGKWPFCPMKSLDILQPLHNKTS